MSAFKEIIGNEKIIMAMRSAISAQKIPHAYIIEGARGMGKKRLANAFAKTILCTSAAESADACCECASCRAYASANHPDVFFVRPEKTKALGVNDIREQVKKTVDIIPYSGMHKIYIIERAEEMTEQAQNALLKTLEEPPSYAVFILLAQNSGAFLPTVLSRCVIFKLRPLNVELLKEQLTGLDRQSAHFYAVYAQGSIGAALELAESVRFAELRRSVTEILRDLKNGDLIRLFSAAKRLMDYKVDIMDVLDVAYIWYRDVAVFSLTGAPDLCIQRDLLKEISEASLNSDVSAVLRNLELIWQTKWRVEHNANLQLAIEVLLLKLEKTDLS